MVSGLVNAFRKREVNFRERVQSKHRVGPRGGLAGFTLLELLTTVSIATVLAVATLPTVQGLARARRGQHAVGLLMSALDYARVRAIADGSDTCLVFSSASPETPAEHRCRSFATFRQTYLPQHSEYSQEALTNWTLLPEGVSLGAESDTIFAAAHAEFYFKPSQKVIALPFVKFTPVGAVESLNAAPLRLRVHEATYGTRSAVVPTLIEVNVLTGRASRGLEGASDE